MRVAVDVPALLARPIDAYIVGKSYVAWVESPTFIGMTHLGSFDRADEPALEQIFPIAKHPALAERYDVLHDIGAVSVFDEAAFRFFVKFLHEWVHELVPRFRKLAVVRPGGVAGAAFTGLFHEWVVPRFDAKLCSDRAEAYAFLGTSADVCAKLDAVVEACAGEPALRRLREVLEANLAKATLVTAASAMSTSTRTLQRMLTANRTSFRKELMEARLRVAQTLLLERDDKVESIADELGFASPAAFSTMFRRFVGETPTTFRERFRSSRP